MALLVLSDSIVFPVIAQLLDENRLSGTRGWFHSARIRSGFDPAQDALWHSAEPLFQQEPWWVRDLAVKPALMKPPPVSFWKSRTAGSYYGDCA